MINSNKILFILISIGFYFFATGLSAWVFGAFAGPGGLITPAGEKKAPSISQRIAIDPNEPKDQVCPINGKYFTKTEKNIWQEQRPVLVMIENHTDARPQSGLSGADIVYEAVAEGAITRFMGVFYCQATANVEKIAPVRSARIYFVNLAAEYNEPIYVHVGGGNCSRDEGSGECTSNRKAWALEELQKLGWRRAKGNDFDTISDIGKPVLYRDASRLGTEKDLAVEHTMVGSLTNIWKEAEKRGFNGKMKDGESWLSGFQSWKFSDGAKESDRENVQTINFDFWEGYQDYHVEWKYDKADNIYKRFTGGQPHLDLENNEQLSASNVVIQFTKEEGPLDEHKHMFYEVTGKGKKALIFQNGKVIEGTWTKTKQSERTVFYDSKGKEIVFVRGPIWIEIVPAGNSIEY